MRVHITAFWLTFVMAAGVPAHGEQVLAYSLNCRSQRAATAAVVARFARGRHVAVREAEGGWSHIVSPDCWAVARYLTSGGRIAVQRYA